ncbi:MAG: phosphohistidine phosphatase SixA [Pseudomonadota bacterium]
MAIYLVQHALSLPKELDPRKGISPEGRKAAETIAGVAKTYGVHVSQIRHSGKLRAMETAAIFDQALQPSGGVTDMPGLAPLDDVTLIAEVLDPASNIMLVGHLPFMERLAAYLVTGTATRPVFRFQNAGIVCLDHHADFDSWVITWSLSPRIG